MTTLVCRVPDKSDARGSGLTRLILPLLLLAGALSTATPAAGQVPPDENWRTLDTEHFRITFPEGPLPARDPAGRPGRAGVRAAGLLLQRASSGHHRHRPHRPRRLLQRVRHVVPGNRITLFARPARGRRIPQLLRRLDGARGHARAGAHLPPGSRGRAGRHPARRPGPLPRHLALLPGRATPTWLTEGIATYYESTLTDAGRVHGTWQDMVLRTGALEDGIEPLSVVSGRSPVWPAGTSPLRLRLRVLRLPDGAHGHPGDAAARGGGGGPARAVPDRRRGAFGLRHLLLAGVGGLARVPLLQIPRPRGLPGGPAAAHHRRSAHPRGAPGALPAGLAGRSPPSPSPSPTAARTRISACATSTAARIAASPAPTACPPSRGRPAGG